jgi:hypothetical protein
MPYVRGTSKVLRQLVSLRLGYFQWSAHEAAGAWFVCALLQGASLPQLMYKATCTQLVYTAYVYTRSIIQTSHLRI